MLDDRQIRADRFQFRVDPFEPLDEQSIDELRLVAKILFGFFVISHERGHCETWADDSSAVFE